MHIVWQWVLNNTHKLTESTVSGFTNINGLQQFRLHVASAFVNVLREE